MLFEQQKHGYIGSLYRLLQHNYSDTICFASYFLRTSTQPHHHIKLSTQHRYCCIFFLPSYYYCDSTVRRSCPVLMYETLFLIASVGTSLQPYSSASQNLPSVGPVPLAHKLAVISPKVKTNQTKHTHSQQSPLFTSPLCRKIQKSVYPCCLQFLLSVSPELLFPIRLSSPLLSSGMTSQSSDFLM